MGDFNACAPIMVRSTRNIVQVLMVCGRPAAEVTRGVDPLDAQGVGRRRIWGPGVEARSPGVRTGHRPATIFALGIGPDINRSGLGGAGNPIFGRPPHAQSRRIHALHTRTHPDGRDDRVAGGADGGLPDFHSSLHAERLAGMGHTHHGQRFSGRIGALVGGQPPNGHQGAVPIPGGKAPRG